MVDLKNKDLLLALVSCIVIISVAITKMIPKKTAVLTKTEPKKVPISPKTPHIKWVQATTHTPAYNYNNMLKLFKRHRKIEKSFYANFEKFIKEPKNIKKTESTLVKLKTEKKLFYKHLKKMNSLYKRTIPNKKNNALRYYLRTIETCIDELKDIIEKFSLNLK